MQKINFQKMAIRVFFLLLLIPSIILPAFAVVDDFATDKSLYHQGDQLRISGTVSYDSEIPFVTIQIFTPGKSNFADFNTIGICGLFFKKRRLVFQFFCYVLGWSKFNQHFRLYERRYRNESPTSGRWHT